jgi:pimeloyl-ACP methyl ester carboxylesterase
MVRESGVRFGAGRGLVGIVSEAANGAMNEESTGVIILNAGLVHRVGPNRLHVRLARSFAERGYPVLRFDLSGIGDSEPGRSTVPAADRWVIETREAMDHLAGAMGVRRFVAIGSCSGAVVAYRTAIADERVARLGLINPNGPTLLRHFMRTASSHPNTWRRLLRGRARLRAQYAGIVRRARGPERPVQSAADAIADLRALGTRAVEMLLVLSEWDPSLDYYRHVLRHRIDAAGVAVQCHIVPGADHQMSVVENQRSLARILEEWIEARAHVPLTA